MTSTPGLTEVINNCSITPSCLAPPGLPKRRRRPTADAGSVIGEMMKVSVRVQDE